MSNLLPIRALVAAHLRGALRLLRLDTQGFAWFDNSLSGARFSFIAALLALPLYVVLLSDMPPAEGVGAGRFVLVHTLSYIAQWAAMPVLLYYACQIMHRPGDWPRLVVPFNWLAFWQVMIYLVLSVLFSAIPQAFALPIMVGIGCYLLGVQGWVYARVLKTGPWVPLLLVVLSVVIDWQLSMTRMTLLKVPALPLVQ